MLGSSDIVVLQLAEYVNPPGHPLAGETSIVNAFAVKHDQGLILIDTGIGWGRERFDTIYGPGRRPLDDALADHGLSQDDVVLIINSHLHFDHCGGNRLFPGVPIYVQVAEFEAAQQPRFTVPEWFDFDGARYVQLEGDAEVARGVHILSGAGHTPGSQAVRLETEEGDVLLACQSIYTAAEYEYIRKNGTLPPMERSGNTELYLESGRRLVELKTSRVLFSHDSEQWVQDSSLTPNEPHR